MDLSIERLSFDRDMTHCQPPASGSIVLGILPFEAPGAEQALVNQQYSLNRQNLLRLSARESCCAIPSQPSFD